MLFRSARLAASGAQVVLGPRSGSKTESLTIPDTLPPGADLASIMPIRVWRVESMRPGIAMKVNGTVTGDACHWRDFLETNDSVQIDARFADGHPAIVRHGSTRYLAALFDETLTRTLLGDVARQAGLHAQALPDGVRISRRGALTYVFNYGDVPYRIEAPGSFVVGRQKVEPQGVAIYRS